MRLHIVFIISPVRHLFIHSRLSPRPAHPGASALSHPPRWPLLFFLHTCAHTFTVSFSLFRIAALSPRMSPLPGGARGSSIARPETRRNDLQCDLWIHPLLPQSCGLKAKSRAKEVRRERNALTHLSSRGIKDAGVAFVLAVADHRSPGHQLLLSY